MIILAFLHASQLCRPSLLLLALPMFVKATLRVVVVVQGDSVLVLFLLLMGEDAPPQLDE